MGSFCLLAEATEIHWQGAVPDRCSKEESVKKCQETDSRKRDLKQNAYYLLWREQPEEECNHSLEEEYIWGFVLFSKYFCSSLNYLHPGLCVAWRIFLVVSHLYNFWIHNIHLFWYSGPHSCNLPCGYWWPLPCACFEIVTTTLPEHSFDFQNYSEVFCWVFLPVKSLLRGTHLS